MISMPKQKITDCVSHPEQNADGVWNDGRQAAHMSRSDDQSHMCWMLKFGELLRDRDNSLTTEKIRISCNLLFDIIYI